MKIVRQVDKQYNDVGKSESKCNLNWKNISNCRLLNQQIMDKVLLVEESKWIYK